MSANFSKVLDTIYFGSTIERLNKLGFSKPFLKWLLSYQSGRSQFVQIDDKRPSCQSSQFNIPQGSILGPVIFNLNFRSTRRAMDMNETFVDITNWSQDSNLALNPTNTNCILFSTLQMSSYHSLAEFPTNLSIGDKPLARVHSTKI